MQPPFPAHHTTRPILEHDLQQTVALLSRTPATLNALLRDLPDVWTGSTEGGDSWTVFDVVGHLIYADQEDWLPRTKRILNFGESRPFEAFNRLGHVEASRGKSLPELLDTFASIRAQALSELESLRLGSQQLALRGAHPALGPVSLAELLAAWAVHDLTHLHQISRIMAHQYREAVGPFAAYLGVLKCTGQSA